TVDIDTVRNSNAIDIAAGACVWLLDLANEPEVKPCLPKNTSELSFNRINLYACDLSLAKFPPKEYTDELGIKAFPQDVTKPFPPEMHGISIRSVHTSFVVLALIEEGWNEALENCRDNSVGAIVSCFSDSSLRTVSLEPGGSLWLIARSPLTESTLFHGRRPVFPHAFSAPTVSLQTGFSQKYVVPYGKLCELHPALADDVERTAQNSDMFFNVIVCGLIEERDTRSVERDENHNGRG
ncbi:hypothetical protein EW146_g9169, partial [Bondarzewia mesenterica]